MISKSEKEPHMISSAKFDKRLVTQAIQRGELTSEEVETYLTNLADLSDQAVPASKIKRSSEKGAEEETNTEEATSAEETPSAEAKS
jgi:hypothetical protein